MDFWPWWMGACGLASVTIAHFLLTGRPLGVSGSVARVLDVRRSRRADALSDAIASDPAALEAQLLAATQEAFGDVDSGATTTAASDDPQGTSTAARATPFGQRFFGNVRWSARLTLLLSIGIGALLSRLVHPSPIEVQLSLGPSFTSLVGDGTIAWAVLLVGGVMVGVGTQMAAGCSSGHGLSGCGRLVPASLIGTAAFFSGAVMVSFLLERL